MIIVAEKLTWAVSSIDGACLSNQTYAGACPPGDDADDVVSMCKWQYFFASGLAGQEKKIFWYCRTLFHAHVLEGFANVFRAGRQ